MYDFFDQNLAKLHYEDADYKILHPGTYVLCAVTGKKIDLNNLCYWNVSRQEAYIDAAASYKREKELKYQQGERAF